MEQPNDTISVDMAHSSDNHTSSMDSVPPNTFQQSTVLPPKQLIPVLIGCGFAVFMATLNLTLVATALPAIAKQFNALSDSFWIATAYMLTNTSFQPLYGRLSDIFGRKTTMLCAQTIFMLGSLGSALSTSMNMLITFRALMGVGGGGLVSLVYLVISDVVEPYNRGKYQGLISAVFAIASVVGPLLGGTLTDNLSWNWAFYINLPVGAITVFMVGFFLKLPVRAGSIKEKIKQIDFFGALLVLAATVSLLLPTTWGGKRYPWNSAVIIALYCVAILLAGITVYWEGWKAKHPLTPGRMFRRKSTAASFTCGFFFGWSFLSLVYYIPLFYELLRGTTATASGLQLLPLVIPIAVISIASGTATSYLPAWSYRAFLLFGMAIATVGTGLMTLFDVNPNQPLEIGAMFLAGFGLGFGMQLVILVAQYTSEPGDIGVATTLSSFFRIIGGAFGVAVTGTIFNHGLESAMAQYLPDIPFNGSTSIFDTLPLEQKDIGKLVVKTAFRQAFIANIPPLILAFIAAIFCKVIHGADAMRQQAKLQSKAKEMSSADKAESHI